MDLTVAFTIDLLTTGLAENESHIGNETITKANRIANSHRPLLRRAFLTSWGATVGTMGPI